MASSRASTPAGRRRASKQSAHRKRAASSHSAGGQSQGARKASATRAKPTSQKSKPKAAKPKAAKHKAAKPRAAKPKAKKAGAAGLARASPRAQKAPATTSRPRGLRIAAAAAVVALGLGAAYLFWFRDSTFVVVERVTVEGIQGPEAEAVTAALSQRGQEMTTLNLDEEQLASAVSRFPTVVAIDAKPDFPHALTIQVTDRPPVLTATDGGTPVPVAGDGTLLRGVDTEDVALPSLQVDSLPVKGRLTGEPLALAQVAGAAPEPLRPLIEDLTVVAGDGIEVTLKGGIPVRFGDADAPEDKWAAVSAILADPQVKTLTHLDVRVPERPSIGGAAPPSRGG